MKRIGILGGTFDPPHIGHIIIAEEVLDALQLDHIWFIPTYEPPHKHEAMVRVEDRIEMIKLAIATNNAFSINTIEMEREGKSYTIDTIKTLKNNFPDTEFYFIIGADMVEYLPNWYQIDELIDLVRFVGVKRPGYSLETHYPITEVEVPTVGISSSLIRKRLLDKKTIKYLVPEPVYTYIKEQDLYEKG